VPKGETDKRGRGRAQRQRRGKNLHAGRFLELEDKKKPNDFISGSDDRAEELGGERWCLSSACLARDFSV